MRRTTASAFALALAAFTLCGATEVAALSCLPGKYAVEADGVSSCVACEAGTFKSFEGPQACLSCPGDGVSAEDGRSCACGAGHFFEDNVPMLSCSGGSSGGCSCTPSAGSNSGTLSVQASQSCYWTISGVEPRLKVTSSQLQNTHLVAYLDECDDADCMSYQPVVSRERIYESGWEYQSSKRHLRVRLEWTIYGSSVVGSVVATWSTTSKAPGCSPCKADTYKNATDAAACPACPSNAVSAEGSTSLSACSCPAGFTGDAGVGGICVRCGRGTYKDVGGSAACSACPSNAVSAVGSTGLSSCVCLE
ncbi:hypothetical protein T484DRAFT_1655570, partial [Baffinella frigidus]